MIDHDQVQAALSARLDGEPAGLPDDVVDAHVDGCAECRDYWERSLRLYRALGLNQDPMSPPDLSETILAGVEPEWRRTANARFVGLSIARLLLVLLGLAFTFVAVGMIADSGGLVSVGPDGQTLSPGADPRTANLLAEGAAFRLALAAGLFTAAWRPGLVSGLIPVIAALWTFMLGFTARDLFLGLAGTEQIANLVLLLLTALVLGWTWLNDNGFPRLRSAWEALNSRPR